MADNARDALAALLASAPRDGAYTGLRRSPVDPETGNVVASARTRDPSTAALVGAYLDLIASRARDAITAPRDALSGDLQVFDPTTGHVSDAAIDRANGMAGLAMTGSLPFSAPSGALRMFGGRNAATADQVALREAEWLHRNGADREHIWDATGWFKAPDGNWKFEIPDEAATLGPAGNAPPGYGRLHHDELAEAYPSMWQNTGQSIRQAPTEGGRFDALGDVIHAQGPTDGSQRSIALHELQHAIQREEGFARGGSPSEFSAPSPMARYREFGEQPFDTYRRLAGEVEARNVQARQNFTPEQRFNTPPWVTQDVPDSQQILRDQLTRLLSRQ